VCTQCATGSYYGATGTPTIALRLSNCRMCGMTLALACAAATSRQAPPSARHARLDPTPPRLVCALADSLQAWVCRLAESQRLVWRLGANHTSILTTSRLCRLSSPCASMQCRSQRLYSMRRWIVLRLDRCARACVDSEAYSPRAIGIYQQACPSRS
jgi:hypothetical protein